MEKVGNLLQNKAENKCLDITGFLGNYDVCRKMFVRFFKESLALKTDYEHLPPYEIVIKWLVSNIDKGKPKGLFLSGGVGVGKTVISNNVVGEILRRANKTNGNILFGRVKMRYVRMNNLSTDKSDPNFYKNIINPNCNVYVFDDVGTEQKGNNFGVHFEMFPYLMDEIDNYKKLAIISTNLDYDMFNERYSNRTTDRVISNCTIVKFDREIHKSLRK